MTRRHPMIRVVIVDDEPLGREGVRLRLRREKDVEIVAEYGNAMQAAAAIPELAPDVLFLDIQMPGLDAFGLLGRLPPDERPEVVFVTAHGKHALRAFDVHAADYVMKPLDDARFAAAVDGVRRRLRERVDAEEGRRLTASQGEGASRGFLSRFALRGDGRVALLPVSDVAWIEAAGDYVRLHVQGRSHLHRATITDVARQLDPAMFVRAHRSSIVNISRVLQIEPWAHGECRLVLKDGTRVKVSRSYREAVDRALGLDAGDGPSGGGD